MHNPTIITADDWSALYVEGTCVTQDHEVTLDDLKRYAGTFLVCQIQEVDASESLLYEYGRKNGHFPKTLKEVEELLK